MSDIGGLDTVEETTEEKVVEMTEKKERKPFHYWTVNGRDYRLKLKASTIGKLENKYRQNILNMLDDIPPLSVHCCSDAVHEDEASQAPDSAGKHSSGTGSYPDHASAARLPS